MSRRLVRSSLLALPFALVACSGDDTSNNSGSSAGTGTDTSMCNLDDPQARGGQCPATTTETSVTDTQGTDSTPTDTNPTDTSPTDTDPTDTTDSSPTTGIPTTGTTGSECQDAIQPFIDALGIDALGAAMIDSPLGNEMTHSDGIQITTSEGETDIGWYGGIEISLGDDVSGSAFPCGDHSMGWTICPGDTAAPTAGDYVVVAMVVDGMIPKDGSNQFQYGFVFDSDGDTFNNYEPDAAYPADFWQATDFWVGVTFAPGSGWAVAVQDATDGNVTAVPGSMARVIVIDNAVLLLIPKSEVGPGPIRFRTTAFTHDGSWGANNGFWNGDACPQVSEGLTQL